MLRGARTGAEERVGDVGWLELRVLLLDGEVAGGVKHHPHLRGGAILRGEGRRGEEEEEQE